MTTDELPSIEHDPDLTLDIKKDKSYQVGYSQCKLRIVQAIDEEIEFLDTLRDQGYNVTCDDDIDIAIQTLEEFHRRITANIIQI